MKSLAKSTMLFLAFGIIASCDGFYSDCIDETRPDFTGKIKFEGYYTDTSYIRSKLESRYDSIQYNEKLTFYKDGRFSYLMLIYQNENIDTVKILNGMFEIYKEQAPRWATYRWHILKLSSDSIYEKQKIIDTSNNNVYFSPDFVATEFLGFPDSLLTSIKKIDSSDNSWKLDTNCFSLSTKDGDNDCNDNYRLGQRRIFCLKPPEQTPEQNSTTGDSL